MPAFSAPGAGAPFAAPQSAPAPSAAPATAPVPAHEAIGDEIGDELDLGNDDMRLPWLEGEDEDYEDERGGLGQTTLLLIAALVAIGVLAGGVIWALRGHSSGGLVADGGVIEAPAEPYKSKPKNPGGEVVDGTGDTSFAVAEGKTRTPQIADAQDPAPTPGFASMDEDNQDKTGSAGKTDTPTPAPSARPQAPLGVGVQVGAYTSRASAEKGWRTLEGQYEPLADMKHRVVQGEADFGTVFRLQALPGDARAARSLCANMRKSGLACQVKD